MNKDHSLALPDHGHNRALVIRSLRGRNVLDETGVERALGEVDVVLLGKLLGGNDRLDSDELVATLLEAVDDLSVSMVGQAVCHRERSDVPCQRAGDGRRRA